MFAARRLPVVLLWTLPLIMTPATAIAQESRGEDEKPIRDNSFLVEEAYNQEPGVVQHIFNLVPAWEHGRKAERTVDFMFTQEWPVFSQLHQVSYAIPLRRIDGMPAQGGGESVWGMGDILLNYRYQLLDGDNEAFPLAVAPRLSLIFPSGDVEKELGRGKLGCQFNLPLSYALEKWSFHFNAGLTKADDAVESFVPDLPFIGHTTDGYNLGASAIYCLRPHFNLMLEMVAVWDRELGREDHGEPQFDSILLPGVRWAPYTEGDTQWVVGCGVPIGLSADAPDIGVFLYMSFEHRFLRSPKFLPK